MSVQAPIPEIIRIFFKYKTADFHSRFRKSKLYKIVESCVVTSTLLHLNRQDIYILIRNAGLAITVFSPCPRPLEEFTI